MDKDLRQKILNYKPCLVDKACIEELLVAYSADEFIDVLSGLLKDDSLENEVQIVQVEDDIWVVNMLAQHGTQIRNGIAPIRYDALETCLEKAAEHSRTIDASLHMPRIGSGLAGGEWGRIKSIIDHVVKDSRVHATIYEYC